MLWSPFVFDGADIRSWDDGAVVYARQCGDTHHVSLLAAEILALLISQQPASVEVIAAGLSDVLVDLCVDERVELVSSALTTLHQAGLVSVVTEC